MDRNFKTDGQLYSTVFDKCSTDVEVHNELRTKLCCDVLNEEQCRGAFAKFRMKCMIFLSNTSENNAKTTEAVLERLSTKGIFSVGSYELIKNVLEDVDVRVVDLIKSAETRISEIRGNALRMETSVASVEPDKHFLETKAKVDDILAAAFEFLMCKLDQKECDGSTLTSNFVDLRKISKEVLKEWHGRYCKCERRFGQKLVLNFVESAKLHLTEGEERYSFFKHNVEPHLRTVLKECAACCLNICPSRGEMLVSLERSSVFSYWIFTSVSQLDSFCRMHEHGSFLQDLERCFNSVDALLIFNVKCITLYNVIAKESYVRQKTFIQNEIPVLKGISKMTSEKDPSVENFDAKLKQGSSSASGKTTHGYVPQSQETTKGKDVSEMTTEKEEQPSMKEIEEKLKHSTMSVIPTEEDPLYEKQGWDQSTSTKDPLEEFVTKRIRANLKGRYLQEWSKSKKAELDPLTGVAETFLQKSFSKKYSRKETEVQTKQSSLRKLEDPKHGHMISMQLSDNVLKNNSRTVQSPRVNHLFDINSEIGGDKRYVNVGGVIFLLGRIVITDRVNKKLKLFRTDGTYMSSTAIEEMCVMDRITRVSATEFAFLGRFTNEISFWSIAEGRIINTGKHFKLKGIFTTLDYNGLYFCLLSTRRGNVEILDHDGRKVRQFSVMREDMHYYSDVHMDAKTNNIYITCNKGVSCVSLEGDLLWKTDIPRYSTGMTEINGMLCVAGMPDSSLHLISKEGEYHGILLKRNFFPHYLNCDDVSHLLLVSNSYETKISVFSVEA